MKTVDMRSQAALVMSRSFFENMEDIRTRFLDLMINDNTVFRAPDLRLGEGTPYEQVIMDIIKDEGDKALLAEFTNQWPPAMDWVRQNVSPAEQLNIIYGAGNDGETLLTSLISNSNAGMGVINRTLALESSLTLQEYADKIVARGLAVPSTLKNVLDNSNTAQTGGSVLSESFSLAEHHLYGSSRLGIQYYRSGAGNSTEPDHYRLTSQWTYGNTAAPATYYNLSTPSVWYSYEYGDMIRKGQKTPWGNWDNGNGSSGLTTAWAAVDNPLPGYYRSGRAAGEHTPVFTIITLEAARNIL